MKQITLSMLLLIVATQAFSQQKLKSKNLARGTVYVNNEYKPRPFSKFLIITPSHDAETNKKIKQEFVKIGIVAEISIDVMPPVKDYTDADIQEICKTRGIDGIVKIVLKGGKEVPGVALGEKTIESEFEASLTDLNTSIKAVTFLGWAESTSSDRTIHKIIKAIIPDLQANIKS